MSAAAERADDVHRIRPVKGRSQILPLLLVHKNSDVRSDPVLLRDDPKSNAGIATIQRRQHIGECRAIDLYLTLLCGVGSQCAGDVDSHRPSATASTE